MPVGRGEGNTRLLQRCIYTCRGQIVQTTDIAKLLSVLSSSCTLMFITSVQVYSNSINVDLFVNKATPSAT